MTPAINATNDILCFICYESNAKEPFIQGPFCPNEGDTLVHLQGIDDQVHITGKHGAVHQSCLDKSLWMKNACPMCRLKNIGHTSQIPIPRLQQSANLTREEVINLVASATAQGRTPNLFGANLRGTNLSGTDLRRADLRRANLLDADLSRANLGNTNLRGAYLGGADLGGANLCNSNLRDANLRGANLRGANLRGANLHNNSLSFMDQIRFQFNCF